MEYVPQIQIPATYMRGGTSKGVFFKKDDIPSDILADKEKLDKLLLRVVGSPDPYNKQIDGLGNASSSTSKTVLISKSERSDHDVDYEFGQVAIDRPFVDWSGNCGNLTGAVGSFAIKSGLVDEDRLDEDGIVQVRIWQVNIQKTIIAHVPMAGGVVREMGDFILDGVAFPAAEVKIEFVSPIDPGETLFPTGNLVDDFEVPGVGTFKATMITAGIPTIFLNAEDINYTATELQGDINSDPKALEMFETIRAYGAIKMGLITDLKEAETRQHTPKVAFVAPPKSYTSSSGAEVNANDIDLNVRALSMGQLHHAMMGTASVAIAVAACVEGTLVNLAAGGGARESVVFGHPSGTLSVGSTITQEGDEYIIEKVGMSRSARIIMDGKIYVPADTTD
ncbi:MAG: 2-methylaconitate cis-trans isomerase [uncultured Sulfurovum sp.]|uniref:2-methylaconitate cis-trans isomerase n=1 Tax=uncultured Sulfurovum sp. TaxID=269237 RepID=A0A6S6TMT8_9BACT|nr:MAG: 2-methylaconitate cis-trans isomerase [uncultured Sulfurovum sp.]